MAYTSKRPGLVSPPEEVAKDVRSLVRNIGADEASRVLGVSRETCLAVGCGALVARMTVAMVRNGLATSAEPQSANMDGQ